MKSLKHVLVAYDLPLPPETATLGDQEFRAWLAEAGAEIAKQHVDHLAGAVALKIFVSLGAKPRDLEKIAARLIDVLIAHNVIAEGSVCDLTMRFDRTIPAGRIHLEAKRVKRPEARLGAVARANVAQATRARWAAVRLMRAHHLTTAG